MPLIWKLKCSFLLWFCFLLSSCSHFEDEQKGKASAVLNPKIVSLTSTLIPYIDALDAWENLIAVSNVDYVNNEAYLTKLKEHEVYSLGSNQSLDFEKIISFEPTVVFLTEYNSAIKVKLDKLGIKTVLFEEYKSKSPIEQLAWIKLVGNYVNKANEAQTYLDSIEVLYNELLVNSTLEKKPVIFSGDFISGYWVCPSPNSYVAHLIEAAGAQYPLQQSTENATIKIDYEQMVNYSNQSDFLRVVVYDSETDIKKILNSKSDKFKFLKPFQKNNIIYSNLKYHDLLGQAIMEPHVQLKELQSILKGEQIQAKYYHIQSDAK